MRLPLPFSGVWSWSARGLLYIISWLGPSNVLPTPIAQIVFPIEKASRIISLLEVVKIGAKEIAKEIAKETLRPFPSVKYRKMKALDSKLKARLKRGDRTVSMDELINAQAVQFELLQDSFSVVQLPNGNYQFTMTWVIPNPAYHTIDTGHRITYMEVQGYPPGGISVSETIEVNGLEFQEFCISLATQAQEKIQTRLVDQKCIGISPDQWSRRFPRDPGPDSGGGNAPNLTANQLLISDSNKVFPTKRRTFQGQSNFLKNKEHNQNIAVEPRVAFRSKISSPVKIFVTYVIVGLPVIFCMMTIIKKLLEKFHKKS